jgi:uncharacterized membrane protein YkoI
MKKQFIYASGIILTMGLVGVVVADDDFFKSYRGDPESNLSQILSLDEILTVSSLETQGTILEVELERKYGHTLYEIKLLKSDGWVVEYKIDAKTGQILEKENKS